MKDPREKLYTAIRGLWPDALVSVSLETGGCWKVVVDGASKRGKFVLVAHAADPMNCVHMLVDHCPAEFLNA